MERKDPLAILVAFRNTDELGRALASLDGWCDALVVDNASDAGSRLAAQQHSAGYVSTGRNIGFAAAVNVGLRLREGRDVLLLNPDARVSAQSLSLMARLLVSDAKICAVAPRLESENGEPERVEWPVPSPKQEWVKAFRLQWMLRPGMMFLVGAVLLLRDEALDDVGDFDERFFLYAEECDWQLRAQLRGWKVRVAHDAVAVHRGGGSSDVETTRQDLFRCSAEAFGLKWYGRRGWQSMAAASRTGSALRLLLTLPMSSRRELYFRQLRR
jgi:GT2 family glycosyltransferase